MDNPTKLHKLTVFLQLLVELHIQTLKTQTKVIKSAGEKDLRTMLLNRYSLKLNEMPKTMTSLIKAVDELLPDIKRIIENLKKIYIHTMATPEEKAALDEVMQLLEAQPVESTSATSLVSLTNDDQIPAQHEKLAMLVSNGKSKEAIGVQLTHEQVKRLSDKDVQKYSKRYEASSATRPPII